MKIKYLSSLLCGVLLGFGAVAGYAQAREVAPSYPGNMVSGRLAILNVYDRTAGYTLPVHWYQGKAYVVGNPGNEYEISLSNQLPGDLLAVVSVDGVNVVSGQTASSKQSGYVLDSGQNYNIRGWRKSQEQSAAFYFTALSDSYAGRTGRPDHVGVIGAALFQRKIEPPVSIPRDMESEPRRQSGSREKMESSAPTPEASRSPSMSADEQSAHKPMPSYPQRERIGTGHGRIENSRVDFTEFKRATSQPAEVLTIYYDSYENLVARGVIQPSRPRGNPYGNLCDRSSSDGCIRPFPKDPNAGFVPDPPR